MRLTVIYTIEPVSGKYFARPACELYRTLSQTTECVLDREYLRGIATYLTTHIARPHVRDAITPIDNSF